MCKEVLRIKLPEGVEDCCDAVASFYLHDKENASKVLLIGETQDSNNIINRQKMIEHLKTNCLHNPNAKSTLDMWMWGKSTVEVIWDNQVLAGLDQILPQYMTDGGKWSLQILPGSLNDTGHHVALGQSPNGVNWWLLDSVFGFTIYESKACLVGDLYQRLLKASGITLQSRTVLLKIT
ncbi:hypothetical protein [Pseudomonas sp. C2B4]|uniref:hypothetical protein n=1 Tax=Pseudomonas sp. C2B4 TaxID=2735270 RepID=UPI00158667F5|nr:hypothetical protein [Pseudomonas sp. C2B4]NUU38217.1 hypothetical protein [Pseudomonas sp. C2B4]